jgi:hypothetical protein
MLADGRQAIEAFMRSEDFKIEDVISNGNSRSLLG